MLSAFELALALLQVKGGPTEPRNRFEQAIRQD